MSKYLGVYSSGFAYIIIDLIISKSSLNNEELSDKKILLNLLIRVMII